MAGALIKGAALGGVVMLVGSAGSGGIGGGAGGDVAPGAGEARDIRGEGGVSQRWRWRTW